MVARTRCNLHSISRADIWRLPFMKLHATVTGRVQGVGFRYFVVQRARELGARGWVRNLPNGDVEVEAVASADVLDELEAALWEGPHFSRVANVDAARTTDAPDYDGFDIR